jgi:hypothetical protein
MRNRKKLSSINGTRKPGAMATSVIPAIQEVAFESEGCVCVFGSGVGGTDEGS